MANFDLSNRRRSTGAGALKFDWYSDDAATFGDRLAAARENAGLSQKGLAEKLGVSHKIVRAWEDDMKEPRANRLQMLSGMLNVSLTWLLSARLMERMKSTPSMPDRASSIGLVI